MVKFLLSALVFVGAFMGSYSYMEQWQLARRTAPPIAYAPGATSTEKAVSKQVKAVAEKTSQQQNISVSRSGAYVLSLPSSWTVETYSTMHGEISHTELDVFNEKGHLVFIIQSPIAEIGYHGSTQVDPGFVGTKIAGGSSLRKVTHVHDEGPPGGFGHYMWDGGDDFWGKSFEIFVPFRSGLYARTGEDFEMQVGVPVAYSSKADFDVARNTIENILGGIREK